MGVTAPSCMWGGRVYSWGPGWVWQSEWTAGQGWGPYRGRTEIPALPGVGGEVVQDKVAQGVVEVLACGGWTVSSLDHRLPGLCTPDAAHLLTSKNSQQPRRGQEGASCPNTGREGGVPSTHVVPPASPLVFPQVKVTGTSQEARLTATRSQRLGGRGHKDREREREAERQKESDGEERDRQKQSQIKTDRGRKGEKERNRQAGRKWKKRERQKGKYRDRKETGRQTDK